MSWYWPLLSVPGDSLMFYLQRWLSVHFVCGSRQWLLCHRLKCRSGLRVLGADVSGSSSWQITVDVNQRRRSATVTASTAAVDAEKNAHRSWVQLFHSSYCLRWGLFRQAQDFAFRTDAVLFVIAWETSWSFGKLLVADNDILFIAGLVAYWPACIHDVALLALYCPLVTSGRLAVCYSQRRSVFSSTTAFTTDTLRWQQLRYHTINGKKIKTCNFVSVI